MNRIERLFSRGGWCQRRKAVSKTDHHPRDNVTRRTHHTPLGVRIHRAAYRREAAGYAAELTPKSTEVSRAGNVEPRGTVETRRTSTLCETNINFRRVLARELCHAKIYALSCQGCSYEGSCDALKFTWKSRRRRLERTVGEPGA